jgi:IS30 family transposase
MILHSQGQSLREISKELNRHPSTLSRELNRNIRRKAYSAVKAQGKYEVRREKCKRPKLLENEQLKSKVLNLFLESQWSPEQISNRLKHENSPYRISHNTIYRAIYAGMFDEDTPRGQRGVARKLRHRGKTRRKSGENETRGKIVISNTIHQRPVEAAERKVIGHWEGDTLIGKYNKACLITLVDRRSRYVLAEKILKKQSELVRAKMIEMFNPRDKSVLKSFTPDRGKEFAKHREITLALNGVQFYFPDPHSPWQRPTNENTNGLLREYFPKSFDFDSCPNEEIARFIDKLNKRHRKCLNWKSPHEIFFNKVLHFT